MHALTSNRKLLICTILFHMVLIFHLLPARAEEEKPAEAPAELKPSATLSTDFLSQYIFRGTAQSKGSGVIQPSGTFSYAGFSANVWGNFDTARHSSNPFLPVDPNRGNAKWSETDFTLSYSRELFKDFSVTVGDVYYGLQNPFPFDLNEVFAGASYNFPWFTVAFTMYREVTHAPGFWLELDITKSIPFEFLCKGASLDLGTSFAYQTLEHNNNLLSLSPAGVGTFGDYSDFQTGTFTAALKIPVWKFITVAPKIGVAFPLSSAASNFLAANSFDQQDTHVWGGLNVTASF